MHSAKPSWRQRTNSLHAMLMTLVALTLLPVLALSLVSHLRDRSQEREAAVADAARAARLVAQALGQETSNARIFLELLATNPLIRNCSQADCAAVLAQFSHMATAYNNLLLVRPDGTVLASARPVPQGSSMAEDQAMVGALQGQTFAVGVSPKALDGGEQGAMVSYATPVQDEKGGILLVLVAQMPVSEVSKTFESASLPKGTTLVLAGQSGRILYRLPNVYRYSGATLPEEQKTMIKSGLESLSGWAVGLDGVTRYYVMNRLDICRDEICYVRVGIPKEAVYAASADKLTRNLLGLTAIVGMILALSRLWARRRILEPSKTLTRTVQALEAGDFSARTGLTEKTGELGGLGASIDHLAEVLEQHKAEQEASSRALFDSEERLRAVFNASSDGVLLLVPDGRVLAMNESAAMRRSKTPEELIGTNILDLIPSYVRNGRRARFEEVLRSGKPLRFEEDRAGRTYAIRLHPVRNQASDITQIASFSRDITERKLAERALVAAKEAAEAASQAKSAFLANMSHELRTPLNGLLGMLQLLHENPRPEEHKEYLDWAIRSAQHITTLVNDILDYAALGSGITRFECRPFCLGSVLEPLSAEYSAQAEVKGLTFTVATPASLKDLSLLGDPLQLGKALRQVLSNAIKFTHRGGVAVNTNVTCRDEATCTLSISVQDTGIGIAPEDLPRVFDPFVQAESPLTKNYAGTGLGLAIARELITRMGGNLTLESTPGVGSTFLICMSFSPAQPG